MINFPKDISNIDSIKEVVKHIPKLMLILY